MWPGRSEALKRSRVGRGLYQCAECGDAFPKKNVQLDHIEPVVSIKDGWQGFDIWIERLYCPPEGFAILCIACHETKTAIEDQMREFYKKKKKDEK
jgi:hypothetical protein